MAQNEFYRLDLVVGATGDVQTKEKLSSMDRFIEQTRRRGEALNRLQMSPAVRLIDRVSAPLRFVESNLNRLSTVKTVTLRAIDRVSGVVGGIMRTLLSPMALLGAGVGVAGLIGYPLGLAGTMEQTNIAMETMLRSVQRAKKFLADLTVFAIKTPFEMPELMKTSRLLMAMGFTAQSVIPTLTALGNAASGLGLGQEGLSRISLALGQMKAKTKVSGEEMRQLTEAGIPAWDILARKMSTTAAALMDFTEKRGIISAEKAIPWLLEGMNERFPRMMERQSRSLFGLFSTLKDVANLKFFWAFGEGIRLAALPALQKFTDFLTKNEANLKRVQGVLMSFGKTVGTFVVGRFQALFKWLEKLSSNEAFNKMNWGQKMVFVLDEVVASMNDWITGPGGKAVGDMFVSLATVAANAWINAMRSLLTRAWDNLFPPPPTPGENKPGQKKTPAQRIAGAAVPLAVAGVMGGAAVLSGAVTVGKGIFQAARWSLGKVFPGPAGRTARSLPPVKAAETAASRVTETPSKAFATTTKAVKAVGEAKAPKATRATTEQPSKILGKKVTLAERKSWVPFDEMPELSTPAARAAPRMRAGQTPLITPKPLFKEVEIVTDMAKPTSKMTKALEAGATALKPLAAVGKIISKIALPLAALFSIAEVATAKPAERAQTVGRVAGGWTGMLGGAALGSFAGPIGTAIGGFIGLFAGEALGEYLVKIKGNFRTAIYDIGKFFQYLPEKLAVAAAGMAKRMQEFPGRIIEAFGSMVKWAKKAFKEIEDFLPATCANIIAQFQGIADWWKDFKNRFKSRFSQEAAGGPGSAVLGPKSTRNLKPIEGGRLSNDAAYAWNNFVAAAEKKGIKIKVNRAFATYADQERVYKKYGPGRAAPPGTSTHELQGGAKSVDWDVISGDMKKAMIMANNYGFASNVPREPWHSEFVGSAEAARKADLYSPAAAATRHALGGIMMRPHLGLVAEAGPEAIIPLSPAMRTRSLSLWQETGERLGIRPQALTGFTGQSRDSESGDGYTSPLPAGRPTSSTTTIHINMGEAVRTIQVNNQGDIAGVVDTVAEIVARKLTTIISNLA